jgi:hypothetical protein
LPVNTTFFAREKNIRGSFLSWQWPIKYQFPLGQQDAFDKEIGLGVVIAPPLVFNRALVEVPLNGPGRDLGFPGEAAYGGVGAGADSFVDHKNAVYPYFFLMRLGRLWFPPIA